MGDEILINVTPQETRAAVVENGILQEVFIERKRRRGIVSNIYKGRISRVLPGMQAAFVDIGLERAAFLHASDIIFYPENDIKDETPRVESIDQLVREGQELLVQVVKDPLGTKGARLTTQITIPSRYLVYLPQSVHIGISTKIIDELERQRLKDIVGKFVSEYNGGFIVRTVAESICEEPIRLDMEFLFKLWASIQKKAETVSARTLIYEDLALGLRIQRDLVGTDLEKMRIDSREAWQRIREFAEQFNPDMLDRIEHYPGERPIFDLYNIEDEIQKSLERRVDLKSGGYLIFDQTEAMTTIDVNTGGYVGRKNLEETIYKTNLEATVAIARQLRLRNLGGIIIIDFIDMAQEEHKRQVLRALEKNLDKDHTKSTITEVSSLGLVEMTRKRTRESLEHVLCEACPACGGKGSVKTVETVCYEIFREILREARQYDDVEQFLVLTSQEVVDLILDEESNSLIELQEFIGKPIKFQAESLYFQAQFDIVLM